MPPKQTSAKQQRLTPSNIIHMTVDSLRQQLRARNLSSAGNKKALAERLRTHLGTNSNAPRTRHTRQRERKHSGESPRQRENVDDGRTSSIAAKRNGTAAANARQRERRVCREGRQHPQPRGDQRRQCSPDRSSGRSGDDYHSPYPRYRSRSPIATPSDNQSATRRHQTSSRRSRRRYRSRSGPQSQLSITSSGDSSVSPAPAKHTRYKRRRRSKHKKKHRTQRRSSSTTSESSTSTSSSSSQSSLNRRRRHRRRKHYHTHASRRDLSCCPPLPEKYSTRIARGLTSSLLKTTSQTKLSESLVSQAEKVDTKPSEPINGPPVTNAPDSNVSHGQALREEIVQVSASTQPSRSVEKSTSTALRDSETPITTAKDSQMHDPPIATAAVDVSTSSDFTHKALIHCHDKLVTAVSTDVITISGVLVSNEFIPVELSSKIVHTNFSPREKATMLVNAVTDKIKIVPSRFDELAKILSEQTCTKGVFPSLSSQVSSQNVSEDSEQDVGVIISTNQEHAVCEGHMYTAWASLDPDDKIDLEARLLTEAEKIGVKFARLYTRARNSFEERGISPQQLADTLKDLTEFKPGGSCRDIVPQESGTVPLLQEESGTLMVAQSTRQIFNALRTHMSFFNYEILQVLIEEYGSDEDKAALATYLSQFTEFCKRQ